MLFMFYMKINRFSSDLPKTYTFFTLLTFVLFLYIDLTLLNLKTNENEKFFLFQQPFYKK